MKSRPIMRPLPLKDFSGWYVLVEWPDGREQQVDDFASEEAARAWIDQDSAAWVEKAERPRDANQLAKRIVDIVTDDD